MSSIALIAEEIRVIADGLLDRSPKAAGKLERLAEQLEELAGLPDDAVEDDPDDDDDSEED